MGKQRNLLALGAWIRDVCGRLLRRWFSPPDPLAWTAIGYRRHPILEVDPGRGRGCGGGEPLAVTVGLLLGFGALGLPVLALGLKPPGREGADRRLLAKRADTFLSAAELVAEFGGVVFGFGKMSGWVVGVAKVAELVELP